MSEVGQLWMEAHQAMENAREVVHNAERALGRAIEHEIRAHQVWQAEQKREGEA